MPAALFGTGLFLAALGYGSLFVWVFLQVVTEAPYRRAVTKTLVRLAVVAVIPVGAVAVPVAWFGPPTLPYGVLFRHALDQSWWLALAVPALFAFLLASASRQMGLNWAQAFVVAYAVALVFTLVATGGTWESHTPLAFKGLDHYFGLNDSESERAERKRRSAEEWARIHREGIQVETTMAGDQVVMVNLRDVYLVNLIRFMLAGLVGASAALIIPRRTS